MKVTQYMTSSYGAFVKKPVFPSVYMSAAKTLTLASIPAATDFLGFGVAITGSSCYNLSLMEPAARRELLTSLYGKEGLGLSVARLTVGASDYSAELYSYDDVEGDVELKHFSIERDMAYVIPMIKEILAINPDLYLFSSPWSPPGWMKTGGSLCGGYMREQYLECYAEYYVRYLKAYDEQGIHIRALTPQNETETHQHGKMPACMWHPDLEAKFIKILRQKLNENGMDVKIWMYDHNFSESEVRVHWQLDHCEGLREACDGIAFHYYASGIESTRPLQAAYPDLRMHFTEGGPRLYDNYDTDWCKWGVMMSKVLNEGFGSFTGWNLMLDETGGPNVGPFFCGGLITRNFETGALSYSGQYRALRHFSPFVDKNAVIYPVHVSEMGDHIFRFPKVNTPLQATAVQNPDGTLVYLLSNPYEDKRQVQFNIDGQWYYVELMPNSLSTVVVEK